MKTPKKKPTPPTEKKDIAAAFEKLIKKIEKGMRGGDDKWIPPTPKKKK